MRGTSGRGEGGTYVITYLHPKDNTLVTTRLADVNQLFDLLNELERSIPNDRDYPHGADISIGTQSMTVGLRPEYWVLNYTVIEDDRLLENRAAVGDESAEGDTYYFLLDPIDVPNRHLVPREQAISILRRWMETQELPQEGKWKDLL